MLTNKKMKLAALAAVALGVTSVAHSSGGGGHLLPANNDVANQASLQRGARNFVNYCFGCHSAQYVRYNRVGTDLGLSDQQVIDNLMFTGVRPSDTMQIAMTRDDGKRWFGNPPPDLSLIARNKGPDYIFTFLKSFYVDPARPTGVNNTVLAGAAMPHVLAELQGLQTAVFEGRPDADGNIQKHFQGFEVASKGSMTPAEYDSFVRDTVNFLEYIAEPVQMKRRNLGIGVILFLLVFWGFAYALKKEFWKDVH